MAKNKIYFWLKIDKKFFDNIFIKRLKNIPGGYTMTVIYIRLMLESLETDCIIYYEGYFSDLKEELALKLDVTEDEIDMTMAYFSKCGLIQIDDNHNANLPQAKAMVMSETNWANYKRNHRRKNLELDNVQQMSNMRPIEIEKDKDIELDKDIDIELEVDIDKGQSSATVNALKSVSDYFQQEIGILSPNQLEQLKDYLNLTKMEPEVIKSAITKAADNGKRSFGYINSILRNWRQNGITTMVQVEEEQRKFIDKKSRSKSKYPNPSASNVPDWSKEEYKTEATPEELEQLEELKNRMLGNQKTDD